LAFALADVNHHPLTVDIADLQVLAFRATQTGAVQSCQYRPVLQVIRGVQQVLDFLRGSGPWAVSSAPRFGNFYIEFLLEELQPRHSNLECLPGKLSLVEEIRLVLADLRRTQLVR